MWAHGHLPATNHCAHSAAGLSVLYKPTDSRKSENPPLAEEVSPNHFQAWRRQGCPHTPKAQSWRSVSCQIKGILEDSNHFSHPSFPFSSFCKAGSLIYDMMGPTYWDKHSILARQELPKRTVAFLCFRFWAEENLTNGPFPRGMRKRQVWLVREKDDEDKGNTDWYSVFQNLSLHEGKRNVVQVANPAACVPEYSCHWIYSRTAPWAEADLKASLSLPTPQSWHRFSRDLFCICSVNTLSREKMPALWTAATQFGNWFLNAFLL